ncbi:hypothetical protein L6E12_14245 [Actinokineospora sp. PR83]|uniref:SCO6745 family protein n=1 Tax=Actinokineospora sp. PR83 TaxID=2884908 RepID=UPI001F2A0430|nr:hypothetical protein [Actinokineospora sp. PR83]MCG8916951.1 hypothetical protein [Actinokineospora sp. PR83]
MNPAARRCAEALNSFHSIAYFAPDLDEELAEHGVDDPMAAYLAGRAAPLGAVGPGTVVAAFNAFAPDLVARHVPAVWDKVSPSEALVARLRAADAVLSRLLPAELLGSPEVAEAATLAIRAIDACRQPGRPLFSGNADLRIPREPHLALWHCATLLREHRGDGHVIALCAAELGGLDALVSHCASPSGMPKAVVMAKRGWTEQDWAGAEDRLRERGLMGASGELTAAGSRLRDDVEAATDRLDRRPYERLGATAVALLTDVTTRLTRAAADAGAFPPVLRGFFVPAA